MQEDFYPSWLQQKLAQNDFEWANSLTTTFPQLLQRITLHDSYWHQSVLQTDNSLLLIIELDAFWNKEFCHNSEEWPFIIIEVQNLLASFSDFMPDDISCMIGVAESDMLDTTRLHQWIASSRQLGIIPHDILQHLK